MGLRNEMVSKQKYITLFLINHHYMDGDKPELI